MRKRREISLFSISFLDLLSGALGAVIILYVAIPKNTNQVKDKQQAAVTTMLEADLKSSQDVIKTLQEQLKNARTDLANVRDQKKSEDAKPGGANLDIGFKFKGKNLVFIIDTSYSMVQEDRMGQVKAGIKMLMTALPANYRIEVVQFPYGERAPFKSLWGNTRDAISANKMDAFDFIYRMNPNGGTPTRDVLLFVLKNYDDISDIVLLSDGAPSLHNSNQKDDIYDILRVAREANPKKVQINAIGVGQDFVKDQTSERYKFLHILSEQTGGFFVGF
jgi:Mg-chelatase subunit ChlD